MAKVPLAQHDDMVKTIASDRADQPLCICILPRRMRRDRPVPDAHDPKAVDEDLAIGAIPIANDIARCFLPAAGLGELTGDPFRARVGGYLEPDQFTAPMPQDQKSIQQPKRDRSPRTNPSTRYRRHDCEEMSSSLATVVFVSSPCLQVWHQSDPEHSQHIDSC